jgi:hypothetical protein
MTISTAQREMVAIVQRWLEGSVSIDSFETAYWQTRRNLLEQTPEAFGGPFGVAMDKIDGAVDSYSDDERVLYSIREPQMRGEVVAAMNRLRTEAAELFGDAAPSG